MSKWILCILLFVLAMQAVTVGSAGEVEATRLWEHAFGSEILTLALTPDGSSFAIGTNRPGALYYYDRNGTLLWSHGTGCPVYGSAVSKDGAYVVEGSDMVRVFTREGDLDWRWDTGYFAFSVAMSADGKYIAVGSDDGTVRLLRRGAGELWKYETTGDVDAVAISADGSLIAAGADGQVYLLGKNGKKIWKKDVGRGVRSVALSVDGDRIAVGSLDHRIQLYRSNGTKAWEYMTDNRVQHVGITNDGRVIGASQDQAVYLLSADGKLLWKETQPASVTAAAISGEGSVVLCGTGTGDQRVCLYALEMVAPAVTTQITQPPTLPPVRTIETLSPYVADPGEMPGETSFFEFAGLYDRPLSQVLLLAGGAVLLAGVGMMVLYRRQR
jgi:WD40 repeat protein